VTPEVQLKGLSEVQKLLDGYKPKALDKRQQKALLVGGRALVPYIRAEAPVATGVLRRSVSARRGRRDRPAVVVGPRAAYRHLVIRGHRFRNSDQTTEPNPFVDRAVTAHLEDAITAYKKALFEEDR
jgi:hypothetical protein